MSQSSGDSRGSQEELYNPIFRIVSANETNTLWRRCHKKPVTSAEIASMPIAFVHHGDEAGAVWTKSAILPRIEVCAIGVDQAQGR